MLYYNRIIQFCSKSQQNDQIGGPLKFVHGPRVEKHCAYVGHQRYICPMSPHMLTNVPFFTLLMPNFEDCALFFFISACEESSLQMKDAKKLLYQFLTIKATIFDTHSRYPKNFTINDVYAKSQTKRQHMISVVFFTVIKKRNNTKA